MAIRIITDSTSDISQEQGEKMGITIVPLKVVFEDGEYLDGVTLTPDEFYQKLTVCKELPHTSQPAPEAFLKYFKEAKAAGDDVVVMPISSKLSGTVQSATVAKEQCGADNVHIVDSLNATIGLHLLLDIAVSMRDEGKSAQEIVDALEAAKDRVCLHIAADTLEYLKKGGRLTKTAAFAGTLMGIKPLIGLEDGVVAVQGKPRGMQRALEDMVALIDKNGGVDTNYPVYLGYAGDQGTLAPFQAFIQEKLPNVRLCSSPVGSVIGTHTGPDAHFIAYLKK